MSVSEKQQWIDRVDKALNDVRPHLEVDGGNVEVVDVTDDLRVKIRLLGTCENCSMSEMTMKAGIEQTIKGRIPEVLQVVAVN